MKEGKSGGSRYAGKKEFPKDTEDYGETRNWKLYIFKEDQSLMIDTVSYHPGVLYLNREDLENIINELDE